MPATKQTQFRLSDDTLAKLAECATIRGLILTGHGRTGEPNRSEALRLAVEAEWSRLKKSQKRSKQC